MAVIHAMISLKQAVKTFCCLLSVNNLHLWPVLLELLFLDILEKTQFNFGLMKTYNFSRRLH